MRLNASMKEQIKENAVAKSGVTKKFSEWRARHKAWVEACRVESLGGKDVVKKLMRAESAHKKRHQEYPNAFNKYILNYSSCLYAVFGGESDRLFLRDDKGKRESMPVANSRVYFDANHPLSVERQKLLNEKKDLNRELDDVESAVNSITGKCTTISSLLKRWPEAKELLTGIQTDATNNLPAVQVEKVNELIGLPTEEAKTDA